MVPVWQTFCVFISTTFKDVHTKWDDLGNVVFPALREKLSPYHVFLYDFDLCWSMRNK
jgi:hypothetical protein